MGKAEGSGECPRGRGRRNWHCYQTMDGSMSISMNTFSRGADRAYKHFKAECKRDAGIADNHVTRCLCNTKS
jgi:hypothetical protein